jgi:hypothetical protein
MDYSKINNISEKEILNNSKYLSHINSILKVRQFSEEFLAKTIDYYDPWICLKYQKNLSPYFCFKYLYDNNIGFADNWISYNDVINYISNQEKKYTEDEIQFFYKRSQLK